MKHYKAMKHYLITAKITTGELEHTEHVLVTAANERDAPLVATNSGYFDRYDDWHVAGTQEVALEHLGILRFYLFGKPLPTRNDGWHITWEIELDRQEGETPRDAAMMAGEIAIDQFMKLAGDFIGASVTKPALTINGQLIDFEHDQ